MLAECSLYSPVKERVCRWRLEGVWRVEGDVMVDGGREPTLQFLQRQTKFASPLLPLSSF